MTKIRFSLFIASLAIWLRTFCGLFCFGRDKRAPSRIGVLIEQAYADINWRNKALDVEWVRVIIGPKMPWPLIQQTFRLITKHQKKTILCVDGDPWGTMGSEQFLASYEQWFHDLLNRVEIPKNVIRVQLLEEKNGAFFRWYDEFYMLITNIPNKKIHSVNHGLKFMNCNLPPINTRCGEIAHCQFSKNHFCDASDIIGEMLHMPSFYFKTQSNTFKKTNLLDKLRWSLSFFWTIYSLFELKKCLKDKKVIFSLYHKNNRLCYRDVMFLDQICTIILKQNYLSMIYNRI